MNFRRPMSSKRKQLWQRRLQGVLLLLCLPVLLSASRPPTALETVLASGELRIISRNGPTTYYEGNQGLDGFEYVLAQRFANHLGVKLVINEEEDLAQLFDLVGSPTGELAAAGLTVTEARAQKVRFTAPYQNVTQQLLYRAGSQRPREISDLYGKRILVIANSSHAEQLRQLQAEHPQLRWHEQSDLEMIDLVEMVHTGTIDFTVVDSNAFDMNRGLYPRARVAFDLTEAQQLAWALPKGSDDSLFNAANEFIQESNNNGFLDEITERFYGHVPGMNAGGALTFARRMETRLPRWEEYLKAAGHMFDLDWQLLAAISYQESHWNSRARSHTGVRGLMMLTRRTAKEVGVSDRVDPVQSIYGGAKYFKKIYDRIPADIQGEDRKWMALAAYNVGYGHMEDARKLTEKMGFDPDKWSDLRQHLPLLAKRKYYRNTRYGYARGSEPVQYVQRIRSYYSIIAWQGQIAQRRLASLDKHDVSASQTAYDTHGMLSVSVL